jgi:hypothetical protein
MELSIGDYKFLDSFDKLNEYKIDDYGKYKMHLFVLKVNANEFDYDLLISNLIDPLIDYSLSRTTKEEYKGKTGTLSKKAREKFRNYLENKGELGELLLYCFLECHLKAPKILSKLELKTSTSNYVNGSDGVHFLRLDDSRFKILYGESKTVKRLGSAISQAFESIHNFKFEISSDGKEKSGIGYERSLVSDQLEKETFTEEEKSFIKSIIYPTKESSFSVDNAFGIFLGYEVKISDKDKELPNDEFRLLIKKKIKEQIDKKTDIILKKIRDLKLSGHNFYIYILPFSNLDKSRLRITKEIIS